MMKAIHFRLPAGDFLAALLVVVLGWGCSRPPTALDLISLGNRHIGEQSKDRVVQIRSEKSIGSLRPDVWYVVYFDPDATFKAVQVKFGAGQKLDVTRPMRLLELGLGEYKELDRSKLKTDSDRAITVATAEPMLKSLKLTATKLSLQHGDNGPVWKVTLWAAKLRKPTEDVDIGSLYVSAETGAVVQNDLHISSVD